ncbi:MAG: hypothetical protein H0W33_11870 [Gammaproteobacteria bacterium]|nr:hypothetical protein [Gammaproteobacteria bacterium]
MTARIDKIRKETQKIATGQIDLGYITDELVNEVSAKAREADTRRWNIESDDSKLKWSTYGNHVHSEGEYLYFSQGYGADEACGQSVHQRVKNKPGMGFQAQGHCEEGKYQYFHIWGLE